MKCIGITIETRPDFCLPKHISEMLSYGCTRLEIGVQSTYEDVARDTNRGHTVRFILIFVHFIGQSQSHMTYVTPVTVSMKPYISSLYVFFLFSRKRGFLKRGMFR